MTEEETEKKEKEKVIINIVDGVPCIYLPPGIIGKKLPPPVVIPFNFSAMQQSREIGTMPDMLKELKKIFQDKFSVSYFELPGPKKKEDKNDNEERERKTEESI